MSAEPHISILMPVRNASATLDRALDSIVRQSFPHWELIAVDDGSSDGSADIAESWNERDSRIRQ